MAAPSLKQARAQLEPVAHDEMRTLVTRVIANSQLEALLAEIDVQRPDKMVRRHSPIDTQVKPRPGRRSCSTLLLLRQRAAASGWPVPQGPETTSSRP